MLAGLNGHGKTTTAGKLALFVRKLGKNPYLVACDTYRPAAIDQLQQLGQRTRRAGVQRGHRAEARKRSPSAGSKPQRIAATTSSSWIPRAGRFLDQDMMEEIKRVRGVSRPHSVLLVLDVVTGQNAVEIAQAFQEYADFDGMVLTKLDGDARGGAALSVVSVTERPVRFASEGEKMSEFDYFYPDRMAGRHPGHGGRAHPDRKSRAGRWTRKRPSNRAKSSCKGKFTFEDFLQQMQMIKKMGADLRPARYDPWSRQATPGRKHRRQAAREGGGHDHLHDHPGAPEPQVVAKPEPDA